MLSQGEREQEAEEVLRRALALNPASADLLHALGLSLVRQNRLDASLPALAKAAELAPDNARSGYVQAVALQTSGRIEEAIAALERVHQRHPVDIDTLTALVLYNRDLGDRSSALAYALTLLTLRPNDPSLTRLLRELESAAPD